MTDGIKIALSRLEKERGGSNRKWKEGAIDAYIWVSDVEALHRQFERSGANILGEPVTRIYGLKEIEARDLDGYLICFGQFV